MCFYKGLKLKGLSVDSLHTKDFNFISNVQIKLKRFDSLLTNRLILLIVWIIRFSWSNVPNVLVLFNTSVLNTT